MYTVSTVGCAILLLSSFVTADLTRIELHKRPDEELIASHLKRENDAFRAALHLEEKTTERNLRANALKKGETHCRLLVLLDSTSTTPDAAPLALAIGKAFSTEKHRVVMSGVHVHTYS